MGSSVKYTLGLFLLVLCTPTALVADRADKLLGVKKIHPPVRRAIDQDKNDKDPKALRGRAPQGMGGSSAKADASPDFLDLEASGGVRRDPVKLTVKTKDTKKLVGHNLNAWHESVKDVLKSLNLNIKEPQVSEALKGFHQAKTILRKIPKAHFEVPTEKSVLKKITDPSRKVDPNVGKIDPKVSQIDPKLSHTSTELHPDSASKPSMNRIHFATAKGPTTELPPTTPHTPSHGWPPAFPRTSNPPGTGASGVHPGAATGTQVELPDMHQGAGAGATGVTPGTGAGAKVPGFDPGAVSGAGADSGDGAGAGAGASSSAGTSAGAGAGSNGNATGDSGISKLPSSQNLMPSIDKLDTNQIDPSGMPSGLPSGMPDINNQVNQALNSVPTEDGIRKRVGQVGGLPGKDSYDQLKQKISSLTPSTIDPAIKSIKEGIQEDKKKIEEKVNEGQIEDRVKSAYQLRLSMRLDGVRKKVASATENAFNGVIKFLHKKKDSAYHHYDHVNTWWNRLFHSGRVKSARKVYEKYDGAYHKVIGDKWKSVGKINAAFADADARIVGANEGAPPSKSEEHRDPASPPAKQELTPKSGDNDRVIDIQGRFTDTTIGAGANIVASIGDESTAIGEIGTIGTLNDVAIGSGEETVTAAATVSVSVGYNTLSELRIGTIDSDIGGVVNRTITTPGTIVAAIGDHSSATAEIGTITGNVQNNLTQTITSAGATSVSIGDKSAAALRIGVINPPNNIGSGRQVITAAAPISASIGYDSTATTSVGFVNADVGGSLNQVITTGPLVSASVGSHTESIVEIGDIYSPVTGNLDQTITVGAVTSVAIGVDTTARSEVGTIKAPVYGSVDMNVVVGDMTVASVGAATLAEAVIGSVRAPVHGNFTADISVGDLTNLAIGIGVGGRNKIRSQTFIGSVFTPVSNPGHISVHVGGIFALGFGLDLDLGPFGELKLVDNDCEGGSVSLGNIGNPC